MERRLLQIAVGLAVLVPLSAGLAGALEGLRFLQAIGPISASSHVSYLSGLLFGIGVAFATLIPRIEQNSSRFIMLMLIVVAGGLARLFSLATLGVPDNSMLFGLCMELGVTPLLCLWQLRVARKTKFIFG
ncbi:MAG TPA: DUF4345 domain-containing protein [Rhizomicrobium sp.]|jgi:hypothetical protein|nr:DUF4345 domain-containing protein [Rhizomicrobium sp.]